MRLSSSRRVTAAVASVAALALVVTGCTGDSENEMSYTPPPQVEGSLPEEAVAEMQALVETTMQSIGASGAVVGVWVPWAGSWVEGIGTQSPTDETPVTTDMSFRIADVTRMMTCDVMYAMSDEGLIDIDAPVPDYVSGVANLKDVKIVDLCNGTSGAGSSVSTVQGMWLQNPDRVWSPLELASYGLSREPVEVGQTYRDSDAGYLLLGLALERASGLSARQLIEKYISTPLGLEDTYLPTSPSAVPDGTPLQGNYSASVDDGFVCADQTDITQISASIGYTDSGVVSTITDLGRYTQASARGALRSDGATPDRFENALPVSESSPTWFQAVGGGFLAGPMFGQYGWIPGYLTGAFSDPETGLTVAFVLNNSSGSAVSARELAWALSAIASKVPASDGVTAPETGMPFTADEFRASIADRSKCVAAPDEGEGEG